MKNSINYILTVLSRFIVYGACLALSALFWWLMLTLLSTVARASTSDQTVLPWDVETTRPAAYTIDPLYRGETIALEPRFLSQSEPMNLSAVYSVRLRWRHSGMAAGLYYSTNGVVHNATGGTVRVIWTPEMVPTGSVSTLYYTFALQSTNGINPRANGRIKLRGIVDGIATNRIPTINTNVFDWALIDEHLNPEAAPFVGPGDLLALQQTDAAHDAAISNVTELVGDGVAGVQSNLQAHIDAAAATNAAQDTLIALALDSATMGGDIEGKSTNATVIATRGREFPTDADVPADKEAIVWNATLGRYEHGSVDLSGIKADIDELQATAVSQTYVDTEISRVEGLVDGNSHVLTLTESFLGADWLQISDGVWQHDNGWMAYNADLINGTLTLDADVGYLTITHTQHISRIRMTPDNLWAASYAASGSGPWTGYDTVRDNIPATDQYAVRIYNWGGSPLSLSELNLYSWEYPERVGIVRDFAGMFVDVDTPDGSRKREVANVEYVQSTVVSGDVSGTLSSPISVDKIKGGAINNSNRANGSGLIWYDSVSEHRYIDMATQFELDAIDAAKPDLAVTDSLDTRLDAVEAGDLAISGDVIATNLQSARVAAIQNKSIDAPSFDQTSPVYDNSLNRIVWRSILGTNIVYAAGTNGIANVPAQSAAFYRAEWDGQSIMPIVLDQQVIGWMGTNGLTIPYGTINILQSNLTSNLRIYDGSVAEPAIAPVSDPDTGIYRLSDGTLGFAANGVQAASIGSAGIAVASGSTVTLGDGYRAVSINEIDTGSVIEQDPHALLKSPTEIAWTNSGGTYTNDIVIATSPVSSNGYASVDWRKSGIMHVYVEMTDLNMVTWEPFQPFVTPGYIRLRVAEIVSHPGDVTTSVSNISASVWTRPDLFGVTNDTASQIIHVDTAVEDRQPVPLAQMKSAIGAVDAADWSEHPATQAVRLDGNTLLMSDAWSIVQYDDDLIIANHSEPVMRAIGAGGLAGVQIAGLAITNGTAYVRVATNAVSQAPVLQWSESLMSQDWYSLTAITNSYPTADADGYYLIVAEIPAGGYLRVVNGDPAGGVDYLVPLYERGERVATDSRVTALETAASAGLIWEGTNLLIVAGGVTNRIVLEAYP